MILLVQIFKYEVEIDIVFGGRAIPSYAFTTHPHLIIPTLSLFHLSFPCHPFTVSLSAVNFGDLVRCYTSIEFPKKNGAILKN